MGDAPIVNEPFHDGEIAIQHRAGERDLALRHGAGIWSRLVPGALPFLARQELLAVSAAGDDARLWTSVWSGHPGFVTSADGQSVTIRRSLMEASHHDPVIDRIAVGRNVGMLAIELQSRRRLRINGSIEATSPEQIDIEIRESFSNCPRYIQRRQPSAVSPSSPTGRPADYGRQIDDDRRALLARADTAFVGSVHPSRGVDVSHRGGAPGFITFVDATTLRVPDYPGNSMFMTLGNFEVDPRASLAVIDFERGRVVSLSGTARVCFGREDPSHPTGGTGRYWEFHLREWIAFDLSAVRRWELREASPYNPEMIR